MCKYLLPVVVMLVDGNKVWASPTLPAQLQQGREHAMAFVRYLLKEVGEGCLASVKILLQHVCMKVPDKAEYRNKAAQVQMRFLVSMV
jgi:condensin-2 complex subunit D3